MLIIACTHASVVLVILYHYMLRNEQSLSHIIQYDVGGCVISMSNNVEYFDKEGSYKNSSKEVI